MKHVAAAAIAIGAVLAAVPLLARARSSSSSSAEPEADEPAPAPAPEFVGYEWPQSFGWFDDVGAWESASMQHQAETDMRDTNMRAFLALIAYSEGTEPNHRGHDPYRVRYGYGAEISDLADHPAITGEWRGEKLPADMCRAAGFSPGCVSTAAGRYQLIEPTWQRAKQALQLADFGPASQDAAAVWLIRQRGAVEAAAAGDVEQAIALCRREWASLPGAGWAQRERRITDLVAAFTAAGGVLA